MGYSHDTYKAALKIIRDNAKQKESRYNAELAAVYAQIPELEKIDLTLSRIGSNAAIAALSGNFEGLENLKKESSVLTARKAEILRDAGIEKPAFSCNMCSDTGYVNGSYCECVKRLAKQMTFENMSKQMPITTEKFENFDLKYYSDKPNADGLVPRKKMTEVLKIAKEYCINFGNGSKNLLFMGNTGLGKTHISLSIASEIIEKGYGVIYGSAQNLFSEVEKEHFAYTGDTEKMDALLNVDLLVIDDLGTEFMSSFTQSVFYNIVNTRILNNHPTIINTNLSFAELEQRYTPRISSRFLGNYQMIKFFGTDIRQQKALKK
ncbi:MAG: hypothetical protein E7526_06655 [Ruminococcaceae bacterium]|nr:hypothetical protein [Oscillospiraceae bacterium]